MEKKQKTINILAAMILARSKSLFPKALDKHDADPVPMVVLIADRKINKGKVIASPPAASTLIPLEM